LMAIKTVDAYLAVAFPVLGRVTTGQVLPPGLHRPKHLHRDQRQHQGLASPHHQKYHLALDSPPLPIARKRSKGSNLPQVMVCAITALGKGSSSKARWKARPNS